MLVKDPPGWFLPRTYASAPEPYALTYDSQYPREGLVAVIGPPGCGKTTMLLANLHRWGVERHNTRPGSGPLRAVYIALEGGSAALGCAESHRQQIGQLPDGDTPLVTVLTPGEFRLLDRAWLENWLAELGAGRRDMEWSDADGEFEGDSLLALVDARAAIARPDIVVLDSLSRAIAGHDENSNAVMSAVVEAAELIRHAFGADALFLVHHPAGGSTQPRGGSALLGALDGAVSVRRRGDDVTVTNTKARHFPDGVVRRFRRRLETLDTLIHPEPLCRMEFDEVPTAEASKPKAPTPPRAPAPDPVVPTPAKAHDGHPTAALRGLPLECWQALALGAGESVTEADATTTLKHHPCLAGVEARRRLSRIAEVMRAWRTRGLLVDGTITNPN